MIKRLSMFTIILSAFFVASAVPLFFLATSSARATEAGIEAEQRTQLLERVGSQATAIDRQFQKFQVATELAAAQAKTLLVTNAPVISDEEVQRRMAKYAREQEDEIQDRVSNQVSGGDSVVYDDTNPYKLGVLGLDRYYNNVFLRQNPNAPENKQLSNVFLNNQTELTPKIAYEIAATEDLNPLFGAIKDSNIGTQWVYLTTAEGMMRLYPWAANYTYQVNWQPETVTFYTVAGPDRDPSRRSVWTAPYNDFARAGVMVTNSTPIYDGDTLVAVMSHDFLIDSIQKDVLNVAVGQAGFAFLIDNNGNIVAHRDYDPKDTPLGQDLLIKLADKDPNMKSVVGEIIGQSPARGITNYTDAAGEEWIVVYATVPTTGWHLGLMQPLSEIIQPALEIRNQLAPIAAGLVVLVTIGSLLLARGISRPIRTLTNAAEEIETSVDDPKKDFSQESLATIGGTSEINRLTIVFGGMVMALKRRMKELDSIYTIGQTITSNVDYDKTLKTLLDAMRQVVSYDMAEIAILQGDTLTVKAWWGAKGLPDTTGQTMKLGSGPIGFVALGRAPFLVAEIQSVQDVQQALRQPDYDGKTLITTGAKSLLGIPLTIGDRVIGALLLLHQKPGHFTEDDKRQLMKLSAQASIAISNAEQVRQREGVLKQQIRELQIEIDETKKAKAVTEIVESDFFRDLEQRANAIRSRTPRTNPRATASALDAEAKEAPKTDGTPSAATAPEGDGTPKKS